MILISSTNSIFVGMSTTLVLGGHLHTSTAQCWMLNVITTKSTHCLWSYWEIQQPRDKMLTGLKWFLATKTLWERHEESFIILSGLLLKSKWISDRCEAQRLNRKGESIQLVGSVVLVGTIKQMQYIAYKTTEPYVCIILTMHELFSIFYILNIVCKVVDQLNISVWNTLLSYQFATIQCVSHVQLFSTKLHYVSKHFSCCCPGEGTEPGSEETRTSELPGRQHGLPSPIGYQWWRYSG